MLPLSLSANLAERTRVIGRGSIVLGGRFVLYWMHAAMRGHENPALEVALEAGAQFGLPVLVYQGLSERHPYACDRHWRFALEGARDVRDELLLRHVRYVFHLERPGQRGPVLAQLAAMAAVVVTDDVPVDPLRSWTQALAKRSSVLVLAVDASCVVPMQVVGRAYERAYVFRSATEAARQARIETKFDGRAATVSSLGEDFDRSIDWPFQPFDLDGDLGTAIAEARIDHGVAAVPATRGGSRAGYTRWTAFVENGLDAYARKRNDPLQEATSGLSPYLHWGMVSPFRIAREAKALVPRCRGAEKFLDECLVWRELAWSFCHHREVGELESLAALPRWARETLLEHEADARDHVIDDETLAEAASGEPLWDACQTSLLRHGELHNNVRMTWGKAFLGWKASPAEALKAAIELNHRYALDGRDASSYGGILWCFGQFDRPFLPEQPVAGSVRPRPVADHAGRLDVEAFARRAARMAFHFAPRVAVIGAGIAGLACARTLRRHGIEVTVFDKARGAGGRLASRRGAGFSVDLGCRAFVVADARFERSVAAWRERGLVESVGGAHRGVPHMSALTRALSTGLDLRKGCRVRTLDKRGARHLLVDEAGEAHGPFDRVVVTVPTAQALPLLAHSPSLTSRLAAVEYVSACTVALAVGDGSRAVVAARCAAPAVGGYIDQVDFDDSGPGGPALLVVRASGALAAEALEASDEAVVQTLLAQLGLVDIDVARGFEGLPFVHRWRYARVKEPLASDHLVDEKLGLFYASDACAGEVAADRGSGVTRAWLSGVAAAGRLLAMLAGRAALVRQGELF